MKTIELDDDFAREVAIALYCRVSYLETGKQLISASDAIEHGHPEWVRPLSDSQKELISKMNKLRRTLEL